MEVHVNQIEKRSWVEINLSQIRRNYLLYKKALKREADIMAVIKADAYGHGDVQIARLLNASGVKLFAVSNIDEAVGLREAGVEGEILLLGYSSPFYARTIKEYNLTQALVSSEYAQALADTGVKMKCQFAIDTGMNRIGLNGDTPEQCESTIREFSKTLNLTGIFTHLCVADTNDNDSEKFTHEQISKFKNVADRISDLKLPYCHCMNSAGGLNYLDDSEYYNTIGNIVRLGIVLYGLKPDIDMEIPEGIAPAISWRSSISQVKTVFLDETIGYGRTFKAERESVIATVTTGYADGLSRRLSNRGFVLINGHKAPIVGRICMDQTLVDVTDIPGVKMGDKVVIIGRSGEQYYSADDMATDLDTIGYEIVCNISKRVQRFYINSNENM